MARSPPPAQRAAQITFILKGHLKNARIAYIRAAVLLAKVRDERLWQVLRYRSLMDYAEKQLRLKESTLYKYLSVYDWLKKSHPSWLAKRPKGFIPELSDVESLAWIEKHLEDPDLDPELRKDLEAAHRKALQGMLSDREFRALRSRARTKVTPLRALLARTRALRRTASGVRDVPSRALSGYDDAIRAIEAALGSARSIARLAGLRTVTIARLGNRSRASAVV